MPREAGEYRATFQLPCDLHCLRRRLATNSSDRTIRQFNLPNYPSSSPSYARNGIASSSNSPVENTAGRNSSSDGNGATASETASVTGNAHPILETELEPTYKFSDPISKVAWHSMSYSPDGEWLAGGMRMVFYKSSRSKLCV